MTDPTGPFRRLFAGDPPDEQTLARRRLVMTERQLAARDIRDRQVLHAFRTVPRHLLVPAEVRHRAYEDCPLPIGEGQTISQPYMVAIMTQLLALRAGDRVLEIGTGSGYQAAILAEIAEEVVTVERHRALSDRARSALDSLGYRNIRFHVGDGTLGWPDDAPYDAIVVTAGAPATPDSLRTQLAEGGRLVIPVGSARQQILLRITRRGDRYDEEESIPCVFVPLIGDEGWQG